MTRLKVAVFAIVAAATFFVSGLRYVVVVDYEYSPPICGQLYDANGNPAGDAGPCPSARPTLPPDKSHWEWTPFWARTD